MKTGVKLPSSYDGGFPAVNFFLAILARAIADADMFPQAKIMVEAFAEYKGITLKEFLAHKIKYTDPIQDAWWISEYIKRASDNIC